MTLKIAELVLSNYSGETFQLRVDLFESMQRGLALRTAPTGPTPYAIDWEAFQRVSRGTWDDAEPRGGAKLKSPALRIEQVRSANLSLDDVELVQLHIERNGTVLRRLHWESHPALQERTVFRFQAAESIPRPASLPRPNRFFFASATPQSALPEDTTSELRPIALTTCPLENLHAHLRTTLLVPARPVSFRESVLVLAAHAALVGQELVIDTHQRPHTKESPLAPLLASLRDDNGEYPQMIVLLLYRKDSAESDHQGSFGGRPLALAHDLVAAGVPLMAVLHDVKDAPEEIVTHLRSERTRTLNSTLSSIDWLLQTLLAPQGAATTAEDQLLFRQKPVLVTRFRSGNLWAAVEPAARSLETSYTTAFLHTLVVGPQLMVGSDRSSSNPSQPWQQPWLRAPIDILSQLLRLPMYPEDLRSGYQLGSYVETVLQNRKDIQTLYYLSWIHSLRSHLDPYWSHIDAKIIKSDSTASYSNSVRATIIELSDINYPSRIHVSVRKVLQPLEIPPAEAAQPLERIERKLKDLLELYCPTVRDPDGTVRLDTLRQEIATLLLSKTPWWQLAKLQADLYITVEPMPFLEYALALQPDAKQHPVEYTIFPWYMQTNAFLRSRACPDAAAESPSGSSTSSSASDTGPRRIVYLCGSIVDPPVLLLSEEDVVERLIGGRLSWPYLLSEIGDCLGRDACTLFLGFSPDDALFRQILRTMFLDRQSSPRSSLIVAPRPDSSFYSYPVEGAEFLTGQFTYTIPATLQRAELLEATPALSTGTPAESARQQTHIQLFWGDPMDIVQQLLLSNVASAAAPPPAGGGSTTPPPAGEGSATPSPAGGGSTTPPPAGGGSTAAPPPAADAPAAPSPAADAPASAPSPAADATAAAPPPAAEAPAAKPTSAS